MPATPIWTVHCAVCARWDEQCSTKAIAERNAKKAGWLVTKDTSLCPRCREAASSIPPGACQHEWTERGSGDMRWRECWLCGTQGPYESSIPSEGSDR